MKILVIALSGIGDALMFTPALSALKKVCPDSEIDSLVMYKGVSDIYQNLDEISEVIYWDFLNRSKIESLSFVMGLRGKYDISINVYPSNRKEYNFINFLIGARKRAAVKYLRKDFVNLGFLNNVRIEENDSLHNVEENVKLIEMVSGGRFDNIDGLILNLTDDDKKYAQNFLREHKIREDETIIGFHPGCSTLKNHANRRWSPEKFARLAKEFIYKRKARVLIFGGPEERELKEEIIKHSGNENIIAVETDSLIHTAAVMKRCNLFVTNDSSLMHVASALQLKVVALIGPTNPNYIRPWKTEHRIASLNLECSPCFYYSPKPLSCGRNDVKFKCIKELPVELVYKLSEELLRSGK
ncbi:ADP-heptose:LPS heptosyltransferase II, putative [Melioribacter roseus P3M-2]|uniref:ADP-heptose:LPS heptosyltransferase II, putative n=1 Tax=Melioribacter roseus (strain DSM 23840 / JCM 17771 / VKM B-2668 / P3M-2) TaxID=1191523 RepID=I6Z6V6_MELRP|nr:glycosyltransferase family 9 protein [Melioribacter roseus]AFN74890.1 ADP-heptose:LPS heptosyltransferase II, putative [Melioribacter roseus P3M-2]